MTANAIAQLSPFGQREIEQEFRFQQDRKGATADEIRMARAIMDTGMVEARPANVKLAIAAGRKLNILPGQVRRNTRAGGITFDLVAQAVIRAERELR